MTLQARSSRCQSSSLDCTRMITMHELQKVCVCVCVIYLQDFAVRPAVCECVLQLQHAHLCGSSHALAAMQYSVYSLPYTKAI